MDIFFYEAFLEEEASLRRHLPHDISAGFTAKTIQETEHTVPPCPFISIRTQSIIPHPWAEKIKALLTRSTGFDHITSYRELCKKDIAAGYLPFYCTRSVAEQALLLWMALLRKLRLQQEQFMKFHRDGLTGSECLGKVLLVVGVGNIGYEICRIGTSMGMEVMGVDIVRKHPDIFYTDIHEAIERTDVIACAMSLNRGNHGYFSYELLRKAKPGAVFINIARGELSPAEDLLKLLDEGHLGGVGLDVYEDEGKLSVTLRRGEHASSRTARACIELSRHGNAFLTPHNAFNTFEALDRKAAQSAEQVSSYLAEKRFIWEVPFG